MTSKSYADSVKLPTLVAVQHPSSRLSHKSTLNIEGHSNSLNKQLSAKTLERKNFITSLIEHEEQNKIKKNAKLNTDQVMELIDEKLTTGYHGVKHLFNSNDVNKIGRLSREGFKCVLTQLCGYLATETWNKIIQKFNLDETDSISFEEFIAHFENNPKVKKEILAYHHNLEMVNFATGPMLTLFKQKDMSKKILLPELSATYCFALLKTKAKESNFDPKDYLGEECFRDNNNGFVMPYHLTCMLDKLNLKLSDMEFQKLWQRFDLNNIGGVKTRIFLRLIDYNRNHLDELSNDADKLRTKSCIVDVTKPSKQLNTARSIQSTMSKISTSKSISSLAKTSESVTPREEITPRNNEPEKLENNSLASISTITLTDPTPNESKTNNSIETTTINNNITTATNANTNNVNVSSLNSSRSEASILTIKKDNKNDNRVCKSSLSETKIKSMVHLLKNTNRFGPNDDLSVFLNNKLNEGYISLKTAFEYIDPDHLNHLLFEEFSIVLNEFNIHIDEKNFKPFLQKHSLIKHNQLIDYEKFLQVFQDQSAKSLTKQYKDSNGPSKSSQSTESSSSLKQIDQRIIEFFHGSYFSVLNSFKENLGDKATCTVDKFKSLLEQRFSIIISDSQMEKLLVFINQKQDSGEIVWNELFKKYVEIEPWKYFKETCEDILNRKPGSSLSSRASSVASSLSDTNTKSKKSFKTDLNKVKEEEAAEEEKDEKNESINEADFSSEDEELAKLNTQSDDETSKRKKEEDQKRQTKRDRKHEKEVFKKVEKLFRTKFHTVNKQFSMLDSNRSEKIDKENFKILLEKCGLKVDENDLNILWQTFPNEHIPFSNMVRRFVIPDQFSRLRKIKEKIDEEKEIRQGIRTKHKPDELPRKHRNNNTISNNNNNFKSESGFEGFKLKAEQIEPLTLSVENKKLLHKRSKVKPDDNPFVGSIINKAKAAITSNWSELKADFEKADTGVRTYVPNEKAMEILRSKHLPLNEDELFDLCKHFSYSSSWSDLDYIKFLKHFNPSSSTAKPLHSFDRPSWSNTNPVLRKMIFKLRELHYTKPTESNLLARDFSNLRSTFKKFDQAKKGYLALSEFKQLINYCQLNVNLDDMYLMQSEFDPELKGVFCYELFIKSLIEKSILD